MSSSPTIINLEILPDLVALRQLAKSLAALDAIMSPDWASRYYSYDKDWGPGEECFSMRDGSGDEFLILFNAHGAVINGFAHDSTMNGWRERAAAPTGLREKVASLFGKKKTVLKQHIYPRVVDALPAAFHNFVFGEPVKSIGTTFCIWREALDTEWKRGDIVFPEDDYGDGSAELLNILDNNPETYRKWALGYYYEDEDESGTWGIDAVNYIYGHTPVTREIAFALNPELDSIGALKQELDKISYPYKGL